MENANKGALVNGVIHFRKVLTSLLWKMKKVVKTLITSFFLIKTLFN